MLRSRIKGTDFVHFYTLARIGQSGASLGFADLNAQRTMQLAARPESVDDWYPPAYRPQVTVALSPLGYLSYGKALALWLLVTAAAYVVLIRGVIKTSPTLARCTGLAMLGAIAFPPFFELILHGQLAVVAMASMIWAWLALRRSHALLAGAALGILGYKVSLLLPVLAILAVAGLWRMLGAAVVVAIGQVLLGAWASGSGSLTAYVQMLADSPRLMNTLAAKPYQMHSWRAFWLLLFDAPRLSLGLYVLCSVATVAMAAQIWRRTNDRRDKWRPWPSAPSCVRRTSTSTTWSFWRRCGSGSPTGTCRGPTSNPPSAGCSTPATRPLSRVR